MFIFSSFKMNAGRCSGSSGCSACTSCNYCKHCNSGGSCGVCGGGDSSNNENENDSGLGKYALIGGGAYLLYRMTKKNEK